MVVVVKEPKGIVPRLNAEDLPEECATIAENCNLKGGSMAPLYSPLFTATLPDANRKTIYKYDVSGNALTCGVLDTGALTAFKLVKNGGFTITLGATSYNVTGMDFTSCVTMYDVAMVIQTGMRNVAGGYHACAYDAVNNKLVLSTTASAITVLTAGVSTTSNPNNDLMPTMTSDILPNGVTSATSSLSGTLPFMAADNTLTNYWLGYFLNVGSSTYTAINKDWQYQFTYPVVVSAFKIYSGAVGNIRKPYYFYLKGSNDGTTWKTIGNLYTNTVSTINTWGTYAVADADRGSYKYYKINFTSVYASDPVGNGVALQIYEIEFVHTVTDISGALYMNGLTGTGSIGTGGSTTWLSWTEDHVNVVKSPEAGDLYNRIYWTGETGGKMRVQGTTPLTTARDVGLTAPTEKAVTFTDSGDWVGLVGHGFANNTPIQFRTITSTTGISVLTTYYVVSQTTDKFKVSATVGGGALPLTTNGTGTLAIMGVPVSIYKPVFECQFIFDPLGTPSVATACTLINYIETDSGFMANFTFPGYVSGASLTNKNYVFQVRYSIDLAGTMSAWYDISNVGVQHDLTEAGGHVWAHAELTQVLETANPTYAGSTPSIVGTANACTVNTVMNFHYEYPSIEDTAYVIRYINDVGKASPNSIVTTVMKKKATDKTILSGIPYINDSTIDWIEVYRIVGAGQAVMYRYVTRVANVDSPGTGAISLEDWVTDLNLGEQIVSVENPPANMLGLVVMPNGIGVGFVGRTVYFSELPSIGNGIESWPILYAKPVQNPIKGLMVTGSEVMVLNEGVPKMITGSDPKYMRVIDLPSTQACIAYRGICKVANTIMYPSGDGMANLTGANSSNGTKSFIQKQQWEALHPELMTASVFDDRLHVFLADKTYLFEPVEGMKALTTSPVIASGCYTDLKDDTLYIIQGANIMAWNRDYLNPMLMTWRSKVFRYSRPVSWNCIKVIGQSYPTTNPVLFNCYANGVLVATTTALSDLGIRLPMMRKEREWMFEIVSYVEIHEFHVAQSTGELYQLGWKK
jgi:hypothetical protein